MRLLFVAGGELWPCVQSCVCVLARLVVCGYGLFGCVILWLCVCVLVHVCCCVMAVVVVCVVLRVVWLLVCLLWCVIVIVVCVVGCCWAWV